MAKGTRSFFRKLGTRLIAIALIMMGLLLAADIALRPIIETMNRLQCHEVVSEIFNSAVLAELERGEAEYSKLVTLSLNDSGEVVSIESNVMYINKLKSEIASRIEREIDRLSAININVPVGTLTGIQLLHGRGFDVGMSVEPLGAVRTSVLSEFRQAGINQTLHRIVIKIDAEVDAVIPGFSTSVPVSTTVVAAETVIVGRVPDAYTHVITDTEDIAGIINDFGAAAS